MPSLGGGQATGTLEAFFTGAPTSVRFRLRAPTISQGVFTSFNVRGYDPNNTPITVLNGGGTYQPSSACCGLYREEFLTVNNAAGVGHIEVDAPGFTVYLDNLSIDDESFALVSFPPTTASGDFIDRGFYVSSYDGTTLSSVTVWLSTPTAGTYTISMTARAGSYDGTLIGTSTATVTLPAGPAAPTPVKFSFPSPAIAPGTLVTFAMSQTSPAGLDLYYDVGPCGLNDPNCVTANPTKETEGTTPPLSVFRRNGVSVIMTGIPGPSQ